MGHETKTRNLIVFYATVAGTAAMLGLAVFVFSVQANELTRADSWKLEIYKDNIINVSGYRAEVVDVDDVGDSLDMVMRFYDSRTDERVTLCSATDVDFETLHVINPRRHYNTGNCTQEVTDEGIERNCVIAYGPEQAMSATVADVLDKVGVCSGAGIVQDKLGESVTIQYADNSAGPRHTLSNYDNHAWTAIHAENGDSISETVVWYFGNGSPTGWDKLGRYAVTFHPVEWAANSVVDAGTFAVTFNGSGGFNDWDVEFRAVELTVGDTGTIAAGDYQNFSLSPTLVSDTKPSYLTTSGVPAAGTDMEFVLNANGESYAFDAGTISIGIISDDEYTDTDPGTPKQGGQRTDNLQIYPVQDTADDPRIIWTHHVEADTGSSASGTFWDTGTVWDGSDYGAFLIQLGAVVVFVLAAFGRVN